MKHFKLCIVFLSCCLIIACASQQNKVSQNLRTVTAAFAKKQTLTKQEKTNWHFKDIFEDSIPGMSLDKAYNFLKGKKGDTIIVAIIDSEIDIDQEDLKDQFWINKDEIPNNNIDDDNNGYIDDIYGWNYVGNNENDDFPYSTYEFTRIIRKYDSLFGHIKLEKEVPKKLLSKFKLYQKAYAVYHKELKYRKSEIARYKRIEGRYYKGKKVAKQYFLDEKYTHTQLDSLKSTLIDEDEKKSLTKLSYYVEHNIHQKWVDNRIAMEQRMINTTLNLTFNDRPTTKDNAEDINDFPYGNNNVQGMYRLSHGTEIASVIAAKRNDTIGIDGINDHVKVMTLNIAVVGNEFDKDIALAIRYAVDNGAKVINMSIGKDFSMYPEWINESIKYAEKNDVLLVTSAGNDGWNIDKNDNFPTDNVNNIETVKNFINVGNTSSRLDSMLVFSSSNYGKNNVDIFAPGTRISCLDRWSVTTDTGTSISCAVVSGIASLIRSYYPDLTAVEVKQIILKSGVSYDMMVLKPYPKEAKRDPEKIPFSSMSKSGKIVNAYYALLLAEEISKKKQRKNN